MSARTGKVAKEYTKSADVHACRLTRNDLVKLAEIVREGAIPPSTNDFFRNDHFRISTKLPRVSLQAENIEDFLENEDLPDEINNLSIYYDGHNGGLETVKHIHLFFSNWYISMSVDGKDENWVLGKYLQLTDFLKGKRPWFWFASTLQAFVFVLTPIAVGCLYGFIYLVASGAPVAYSTGVALLFIAVVTAFYLHFKSKFMPHVQIILRTKRSFLSYDKVIVMLMLASLVVSIIGVITRL